ncbi:MAG: FkbM family methyltransferase [Chlamydiales bacterium]|nr:FkbM family methyltransferase [Chlamydiales bacterium]
MKMYCLLLLLVLFGKTEASSFGLLNPEKIHSSKKETLMEYLEDFPVKNYRVYHTKQPGYFYVDAVDDTIKDTLKRKEAWQPFLHKYISLYALPGSTVVDVGAHVGTYTAVMARAVKDGRVVAIEPQPKLFRELVMNMALNQAINVDFYWAGAGSRVGEIELSPLASRNEGSTPLAGGTGMYVDLITIDSLNLKNVSFIKIDAVSMENEILDGARETIAKSKPVIVVEIMGEFSYETATSEIKSRIDETIKKLHSFGYTTHRVSPHDYLALPIK